MILLIKRVIFFGVIAVIVMLILMANGYMSNPLGLWEISKNRARAEAKLAELDKVARAAVSAKHTSESWTLPSDDTVLAIHLEHLRELGRVPPPDRVSFCEARDVNAAAAFVRSGRWPDGRVLEALDMRDIIRGKFDTLDRVRHVIVIRPVSYTAPQDKGIRFVSGYYTGEALAFDVANARLLGGFEFGARNSNSVEGGGNMHYALVRNLSQNASEAFRDELKKRAPALTAEQLQCLG